MKPIAPSDYVASNPGAQSDPQLIGPKPIVGEAVDPASITTPGIEQTRKVAQDVFQKQQAATTATAAQSLEASVKNWDTTRIADTFMNRPGFTPDLNFNKTAALAQLDYPVDEDRRKFLFEAQSADEFNWRSQQLQDMQSRDQLAAAHPFLNAVVQFADPAYLAVDLLTAGAGNALKFGRLAGAAIDATGQLGVQSLAAQNRPVSDLEIFGGAAMHGAATAFSIRKAARAADETRVHFADTPDVNSMTPDPGVSPAGGTQAQAHVDLQPQGTMKTTASELVHTVLDTAGDELPTEMRGLAEAMGAHLDTADAVPAYIAPLDAKLQGSSVTSLLGDRSVVMAINEATDNSVLSTVQKMTPLQRTVVLHEAAHATTIRAINAFGRGTLTDPTLREAVSNIQGLRAQANAEWQAVKAGGTVDKAAASQIEYGLANDHEFVSQLFDSPDFRGFLKGVVTKEVKGNLMQRAVRSMVTLVTGKSKSSSVFDSLTEQYGKMLDNPQLTKFSYNSMPHDTVTADSVPKNIQDVAQAAFSHGRNGTQTQPKRPWGEWSLYKDMVGYGPEGQAAAARLLDDPLSHSGTNAAAIYRETHARFDELLSRYDNTVLQALRDQGWGWAARIKNPVGFRHAQQEFEEAVRGELDRRMVDPAYRGGNVRVAQAVDRLGEYSRSVGEELERAGMVDKGFTAQNPYYYPHRMSVAKVEQIERTLADGGDIKVGQKALRNGLAVAVQHGIGTDLPTAKAIAYAMIERARRKGYGIDNSGHILNGEGRDELVDIIKNASGILDEAKMRAEQLLRPAGADSKNAPMLKTRINVDMFHDLGKGAQVRDLFDDSITSMMDNYNHRVSGRLALHQVGLGDPADRQRFIENLAKSIPEGPTRRAAVSNTDNIFKYFLGEPVGEEVNAGLRKLSALAQATGLAAAGFWQIVEYGTMMQRFGATRTFGAALRAIPEMRALMQQMKAGTKEGRQVALDVEEALTAQVTNDIRMRPVMNHYEDMFTADKSPWMMRLEQARDATMFVNMQKYIHYHQVRTMAAIVVQDLRKAAMGDTKAIAAMQRYGADDTLLADIRKEVGKAGTNLDQWDEGVFNRSRRIMMNAMDDGIVRARIGEMPAFMEFSTLGKFLFTFRRFVAATHNKTLVSTIHNEGARGMATLMAYQYPLAMMVTAANNVISGQGFDPNHPIAALAGQALNYTGAIGFASEFTGVLSGQQRTFGAPGLLFADRVYGIAAGLSSAAKNAAQGKDKQAEHNLQTTMGNTLMALPLISIVPGVRALSAATKD